jgi:hypothetical protein
MTDENRKRKLEAALHSARATVALLEAELEQAESVGSDGDQLLNMRQALAEFGLGHNAIKTAAERGDLAVSRGARGRLMVERAEIRRYIKSRPVRPRNAPPAANLTDWDRQAERSLRGLKGGRT